MLARSCSLQCSHPGGTPERPGRCRPAFSSTTAASVHLLMDRSGPRRPGIAGTAGDRYVLCRRAPIRLAVAVFRRAQRSARRSRRERQRAEDTEGALRAARGSRHNGAGSSSPGQRECARVWCLRHSRPPGRTPSWRRSTFSSTFPPSGVGVVLQPAAAEKLAAAGKIQLAGDQSALTEFAGLMDDFDPNFSVITP